MRNLQILASLCVLIALTSFAQAAEASMAKRGNVRFGPSTKDAVVCTLNAETPVHILGLVDGSTNWYKIKFPSQGHAWMHGMNLAKTKQENVLRVTTNGANVRQDATKGGAIVTELKMNDTVQWKGPKVGQWYAVYVPDAVAYVHASVLFIQDTVAQPANNEAAGEPKVAAKPLPGPINHPTDKIWQDAVRTYESYYQQLQQDSGKALQLNWAALSDKLKLVIQDHPDLRTRIYAKRLFNGIQRVVSSAGMEAAPEISSVSTAGTAAKTPVNNTKPAAATTTSTTPAESTEVQVDLSDDEPVKQPATDHKKPDIAGLAKTDKGVIGWLQDLEVQSIGVEYVILGDDGISAFIKLKDGVNVNLKDLHWQRVHVNGETQIVDHEVEAQYKGIPLIIVSELKVLK